jgi:hypothetical protein
MKEQGKPSGRAFASGEVETGAERVLSALHACLERPPRMAGTTDLDGRPMLVRRLMPQEDSWTLEASRAGNERARSVTSERSPELFTAAGQIIRGRARPGTRGFFSTMRSPSRAYMRRQRCITPRSFRRDERWELATAPTKASSPWRFAPARWLRRSQRALAVGPTRRGGTRGWVGTSATSSEQRTVVFSSWSQLPVAASTINGISPPSTSRMIQPAPME